MASPLYQRTVLISCASAYFWCCSAFADVHLVTPRIGWRRKVHYCGVPSRLPDGRGSVQTADSIEPRASASGGNCSTNFRRNHSGGSTSAAKLLVVPFPVAPYVRQDALVPGVRTQVVPVFVALEPWVVVVPPKSRKEHYRNDDKPNTGGVLWNFFKRTITITEYRNAKDDVNPAKNRTFGGISHD